MAKFTLIVLCVSFAIVQAAIFDWSNIREKHSKNTLIRFNSFKLTPLKTDDGKIKYLTGRIPVLKELNNANTQVSYRLRRKGAEGFAKIPDIPDAVVPVCEYFTGFYKNYTFPMTGLHNDFPQVTDTDCVINKGVYHLYAVNSTEELIIPSGLEPGKYFLKVVFLNNKNIPIGGHIGRFTSINV